ncbi:hypothetical protein [Gordonia oryzae]|uniref:hypothetical protein n=1 Tax=Gordonia oryzae TaxID=2487349 RepID=UPI003F846711
MASTAASPISLSHRPISPIACPAASTTCLRLLLRAGIIVCRSLIGTSLPPGGRMGLYGCGGKAQLAAQIAIAQGARVPTTPPPEPLELPAAITFDPWVNSCRWRCWPSTSAR